MRLHLAMFAVVMGLAAATPAWADGQTAVTQITDNTFAVTYRGDTRENRRTVAEKAMLGAAELTLEKGFEWFLVTNTISQRVNLAEVTPLQGVVGGATRDSGANAGTQAAGSQGSAGANAGNAATAGVDPGAVGVGTGVDPSLLERRRPRNAYQTVLMIQMGRGNQVAVDDPNGRVEIFDAASVAQSLRGE